VLRVLANLLAVHGIDYNSSDEIRDALQQACGSNVALPSAGAAGFAASLNGSAPAVAGPWVDIPIYQGDALVRGSEALGKTKDGHQAREVI
jgi:hypothetical protein